MDANEVDSVMLAVLAELRLLREVNTGIANTMLLVNQTCQRVLETADRLDARVTLLAAGAAE